MYQKIIPEKTPCRKSVLPWLSIIEQNVERATAWMIEISARISYIGSGATVNFRNNLLLLQSA